MTTVDCTYNYTHSGKVSKYVICTTTMYVVPISAKSYAFCAMLPMASQVTPMPVYHLVWYRVCYLSPTRQTTTMEPLVDYPHQHIKHAHLQSWLWVKIIFKHYWRLKTIKNINLTKTISHNMLQEPIKIQHSPKGTTPPK